ncbi:NADPH oxidase 5, partial [Paramuricea clavata]
MSSQDNGTRTINQSVIEIPAPVRLDIPGETQKKNECLSSKSRRSDWFGNSFGPLAEYGKLKKTQFIMGARNLEGFPEHLFDIFDVEQHGYISIQELVGGLRLLWQRNGKKKDNKICRWFTEYFENVCGKNSDIHLAEFKSALDDETFTQNVFDLFDSDQDGEIDIGDLTSSLDLLERSSTDTKWFLWIEERFNISVAEDLKITFHHFKKALHLDKTFFAERFFTLFDDNGDGMIDMKELIAGLELFTNGTVADKLTFLFRVYDIDGNGYLSEDEMRTVLKSCMEESKLKLDDQQVDELMEVLFEEIETNHKGEIGLDQFKAFLSKHPGVTEHLSISAAHLFKPPVSKKNKVSSCIPKRLRWEYIKKNPFKVFFVTLYVLLNAALCIWVGVERRHQGGWIILARINGMCLNFNSMFILVVMMKGLLTWLRSTRFGKFFPIDQHIIFHKCVAAVILLQSVLHFIGHLGRYITTDSPKFEVWEYMFTTRTPEGWANGSAGITGVLLLIILVVMFILSQPSVRKRGFFE